MTALTTSCGVPDIDFCRFAELGDDVLRQLDALREADPLYWSEANHCWIATGHDLVAEGFSGRLPLSAKRHEIIASFFPDPIERDARVGYLLHIFSHFLINLDPPEQSRLRKLLMVAFSKQVSESFRPFVRARVAEVMAELDGVREIDFVDQVARRLTARVILHVIGLSHDHLPRMEFWAHTINSGLGGSNPDHDLIARTNDVLEEMRDVLEAEIARRRGADRGDFLSLLLTASDGQDRLTRDEVIAQLILILIAGHDTTLNTMALSVAKLAGRARERTFLRENPGMFDSWIMELMRVVAMSTSMARLVSEDFEWQGRQLKKGEFVFLMIAAANRDPAVFEDPDRIDFSRSQQANMTFAPGRHFCVGHWFAKMLMSEFFPAFLGRFEGWEALEDRLMFTEATGFRGLVRLPLRLHARGGAPVDATQ